jgi:hypothetical protein
MPSSLHEMTFQSSRHHLLLAEAITPLITVLQMTVTWQGMRKRTLVAVMPQVVMVGVSGGEQLWERSGTRVS